MAGRVVGETDGLLGRTAVGDGEAEGVAEMSLTVGEADGRADVSATVVALCESAGAAGSAQPVSTAASSAADVPATHILMPRIAALAKSVSTGRST
ncbi:hypothetical protein ACFT7S_03725 [Streptomyces sp. NPDC057136]|uniref:hypothetical protein n=1 Tax=Streptomyces sp. NPDC057136 TaxID=3346029 RepID=UPI00362D8055